MVMSQPSITKALAMAIGGKDPLEKVILQTSPLAQGIEAPIRFQEKVAALDPMSSPSASETRAAPSPRRSPPAIRYAPGSRPPCAW